MADRRSSLAPVDPGFGHPAFVAWRRLDAGVRTPAAVHVLKENWKTLAYRLIGCGPDGGDVVATRRPTSTTLIERRIYTEILPRASQPNVRLLGALDEEDGTSWMFLDDAGEHAPDLRGFAGRVLAGAWLGRLHHELRDVPAPDGLPDRGPIEALRALRASRAGLSAVAVGPYVEDDDRRFIGDLVRRLDLIEGAWDTVTGDLGGLPSTLVHADLAAKNMRITDHGDGERGVVAFDWEMSGWGLPIRDLALVDIGTYAAAAGAAWGMRSSDLGRMADIGRLFSMLAAVEWEMVGLQTPWPRRYLARLRIFHDRLGTAAARTGVADSSSRPLGRERFGYRVSGAASDDMGDRALLERGLRSMEPQGPVRIVAVLDQGPNVYRSTYPSAIVRCEFDDGIVRRVFVKRHVPGLHAGGSFWDGGAYEADVYRDVLSASRSGTADYYGSWSDPDHGDTFLAVEYIEGWRLSRSEPKWVVEGARWLARLHRDVTPIGLRHPAIRRYDGSFFARRSEDAVSAMRRSGAGNDWREPLFRAFDDVMIPRLLGAEPSFVHGEPYPQNIIVSDGQVRVVDWQSAAIASGAIDLACLTMGRWPAPLVAESEAAYVAERWGAGPPPSTFAAELAAARVYWAMRWLGADADPTTAQQREIDLSSLHESAIRLGLAAPIV